MSAPDQAPEHREDIKAAIRKRSLTLRDVCSLVEGRDVSPSSVSDVLAGRTTSERIETALSLASGYSLAEVQQVTRGRSVSGRDRNTDRNIEQALKGHGGRIGIADRNVNV